MRPESSPSRSATSTRARASGCSPSGSWGFSFYVLHFGEYNKTYGAIGGAVVMLMWMWISAMVLLTGALINAVLEDLSRRTTATAPEAGTAGFAMPGQGALQPRSAS